jgi:hypothetical protein
MNILLNISVLLVVLKLLSKFERILTEHFPDMLHELMQEKEISLKCVGQQCVGALKQIAESSE